MHSTQFKKRFFYAKAVPVQGGGGELQYVAILEVHIRIWQLCPDKGNI